MTSPVPPPLPWPDGGEPPDDLDTATARELVAEMFYTFGEAEARALATAFRISFGSCAEAIERAGRRLQ